MNNTAQSNPDGELERLGRVSRQEVTEERSLEKKARKWPTIVLVLIAVLGVAFGVTMMVLWLQEREETPEVIKETETVVETDVQKTPTKAIDLKIDGNKQLGTETPANWILGSSISAGSGVSVLSMTVTQVVAGALECGAAQEATEDSSTIDLTVNWDELKLWYNLDTGKAGYENISTVERADIFGVDSDQVVNVIVSGFGQSVGNEVVLFLMGDGTIEYIPVEKAAKTGKFRSYGKIAGVDGVIEMMSVARSGGCGSGKDIIAQKANGEFWSLYEVLSAQGVWD